MSDAATFENIPVVVIGGGQAGLSVGYCLKRLGIPFVILEAEPRIGNAWRKRWDSLRLFTPAKYDGLIGLPFPAPAFSFPTKDEMADYLEAYATTFDLPVRTGVKVSRVSRRDTRYRVEAAAATIECEHVVVAMATFQAPRVPAWATSLDGDIVQLHSSEYRNSRQLRSGDVLIVGAGNSGAEIGVELARTCRVYLAGRHPGHVPFRMEGPLARAVVPVLFRFVFHRVLTVDTPLGRRARRSMIPKGGPLIRVKPADLAQVGIQRTPRVTGVKDGKPQLADGRVLDVANVVWCTGFHPGFNWIDLPTPLHGEDGEPVHDRGIVPAEPGFYFVGLHFLYSLSSTMIHGVGRDAERIARAIDRRRASRGAGAATTEFSALSTSPPAATS